MRNAIRNRILETHPELTEVYQPFMPNKSTEKPYAVLKMGEETPDVRISHVFSVPVEVWVYVEPETFETTDNYIPTIVNALKKELTTEKGFRFGLEYRGIITRDYFDEEWEALTLGLSFETIVIR